MASVALLGGTFDPIHRGHLDLARRVLALVPVESLWLCPARQNPLKQGQASAPEADRLEMVRRAVAAEGNSRIRVLDFELKREGPSYTLFTVRHLKETLRRDVVLVMGDEVFLTLPRWHEPRSLLREADVLVVTREGKTPLLPTLKEVGLTDLAPQASGFRVEHDGRWVERHTIQALPVSATQVREALRADPAHRPEGLHPEVWSYIKEKGLYAR